MSEVPPGRGETIISYVWIPTFSSSCPHVIHDITVPETFYGYELQWFKGPPDRYVVEDHDPEHPENDFRIEVRFDDQFMVFESTDNVEYSVISDLHKFLKPLYHVDVLHNPNTGLVPFEAESLEDAVEDTAWEMVRYATNRIKGMDNTSDVSDLKEMYLECRGLIDYGLAFVNHYKEVLGESAEVFRNHLKTMSKYINVKYQTVRDDIADRLAYSSAEIAQDSARSAIASERISRTMQDLTAIVLCITVLTAILAIGTFVLDTGPEMGRAFWVSLTAAIALPIIIAVIYWIVYRR